MEPHSAVVKKDTVKEVGPRPLAAAAAERPAPTGGEANVRIVQDRPEGVVIEVTCSCGRTIQVQCDYDQAPAPAPAPDDSARSDVE